MYKTNIKIKACVSGDPPKSPEGPLGAPGPHFKLLGSLQAPERYAAATQSGLETQLILKRSPGVKPRSHFEFVVTAAPSPKQQFTDHTGQTSSHSPAPTACLTTTRSDSELNVRMTSEQKIYQDVFYWSDRQNPALRG